MDSNEAGTSASLSRKHDDLYEHTVDNRTQKQVDERAADYNPGVPGTATAASYDLARRSAVAAATEIGDPHGRIPSAQTTRDQLAVVRSIELPGDTPSSSTGTNSTDDNTRHHRR